MERVEIRIAGFGGQGVIAAGYIIANAASMHDAKHVVMFPSYGPEARGGACSSDVIISNIQIGYPKTTKPDILVAMSLDAYYNFIFDIKEGGTIIYDDELVQILESEKRENIEYISVPASKIASELGTTLVSNIILLGVLIEITKVVNKTAVEKSIKDRFTRYIDINLKALRRGIEFARRIR